MVAFVTKYHLISLEVVLTKSQTQFKTGQKKPSGSGRLRGTPNKKTQDLVQTLEKLGIDPLKIISEEIGNLSPEKRINSAFELMKYIYPTRKSVDANPTPESEETLSNDDKVKIGELSKRALEFFDKNKR